MTSKEIFPTATEGIDLMPARLDRDFGRKSWGDEGYAMEELVAELGSAFLATDLELTPEAREDQPPD